MTSGAAYINRKAFFRTAVMCLIGWLLMSAYSASAKTDDETLCLEIIVAATPQPDWAELHVHKEMQSRDCHSRLSDALKAQGGSNEVMSHAVYHQIMSGKSFRKIPLWPDKHRDWDRSYDGYDYFQIFWPALNAAEKSWDEGFEGGVKHDFAIGWTLAILEEDFEINDARSRGYWGRGIKTYLVIPVLILFFLILLDALFVRFGWFPSFRPFERMKGSPVSDARNDSNFNISSHNEKNKIKRYMNTFLRALPIVIPMTFLGCLSGYFVARKVNFSNASEFVLIGLALGFFLGLTIGILRQK